MNKDIDRHIENIRQNLPFCAAVESDNIDFDLKLIIYIWACIFVAVVIMSFYQFVIGG